MTTQAAQALGTAVPPAAARSRLAGNFDTFLTLLTTQLRNQSPTDPLDTNQMTAQLVQFASVEQQMEANRNLERLVALQGAAQLTAAAPLIGRRVEVSGDSLPLQGGEATLRLPAAGAARTARVLVSDQAGRPLREEQVALGSAPAAWRWDGRDGSGRRLEDGAYRVAVTGADALGAPVSLAFTVLGTATGAERQGEALRLRLGAASYGFEQLRSLSAP